MMIAKGNSMANATAPVVKSFKADGAQVKKAQEQDYISVTRSVLSCTTTVLLRRKSLRR